MHIEIIQHLILIKDENINYRLATFIEGDPKAPLSIATTLTCRMLYTHIINMLIYAGYIPTQ